MEIQRNFLRRFVTTLSCSLMILRDTEGSFGAHGIDMMKGTFEAEQSLYDFCPSHVPKPVAWGTYVDVPDTHFYLCEFVDMYDDLPSPRGWASTVSALHLNSMGKSPTGEFGFHVQTHLANVPVNNSWNPSWSAFWTQQMKGLFDHEETVRGPDEELSVLKTSFLEQAIPAILGPLEEEGRSIKPCLIHSDLWPGNIKPRTSSNELCIFDACAYWGHNEGIPRS
jgi:fructosamine-3-kinase